MFLGANLVPGPQNVSLSSFAPALRPSIALWPTACRGVLALSATLGAPHPPRACYTCLLRQRQYDLSLHQSRAAPVHEVHGELEIDLHSVCVFSLPSTVFSEFRSSLNICTGYSCDYGGVSVLYFITVMGLSPCTWLLYINSRNAYIMKLLEVKLTKCFLNNDKYLRFYSFGYTSRVHGNFRTLFFYLDYDI